MGKHFKASSPGKKNFKGHSPRERKLQRPFSRQKNLTFKKKKKKIKMEGKGKGKKKLGTGYCKERKFILVSPKI